MFSFIVKWRGTECKYEKKKKTYEGTGVREKWWEDHPFQGLGLSSAVQVPICWDWSEIPEALPTAWLIL